MNAKRKALHEKLSEVVEGFTALENDRPDVDLSEGSQMYAATYVLVIGYERVDDNGDSWGPVGAYPKDGSQPQWKMQGILGCAMDLEQTEDDPYDESE